MLIDSSIWHSLVTISLWIPILHQAISILLEKNSLRESISDKKGKESLKRWKKRMKNGRSTYNTDFALNSVHSPWLCKECGGESIQAVCLFISNNMNTLVSEIFICKKIKETMILYMDFWSQSVNKVHFPSPFDNRTICSYCSVMHIIQYTLFYCILFSAGEFMHLKGCNLRENGVLEVFFYQQVNWFLWRVFLCDFMKGNQDWVRGNVRFSFQMIDVMIIGLVYQQFLGSLVPFAN